MKRLSVRGLVLTTAALGLFLSGCKPPSSTSDTAKSSPPATVPRIAKEDELISIRLTPEAETRLGVATVTVERRKVERTRLLGGEVILPPGARVQVAAPLAGTLVSSREGLALRPGDPLTSGQAVFSLVPILTPAERTRLTETHAAAEGEAAAAKVQVEAAAVALNRAERLLQEKAGSVRAVEEARAQLDLSRSALQSAQTRQQLLALALKDDGSGASTTLPILSPIAGVLTNLQAPVGQTVPAGSPLFEVAKQDIVWIRVPVYVGDLPDIQTDSDVRVSGLTDNPGVPGPIAQPVSRLLQTGNAAAVTVDLYYEMANTVEPLLRPGQKVGVRIRLRGETESLVIPWLAVFYDINGGAWVYENVAPHAYTRQRVEVREVVEGQALLSRGPRIGAALVTAGVAELVGTEFGYAK